MKYKIKNGTYGNKEFKIPLDKIRYLCHGVIGDFVLPFYHDVFCVCWYNENSCFHEYEILGEFKKGRTYLKYLFFGEPKLAVLKGFETEYKEKDIQYLLDNFESEKKI